MSVKNVKKLISCGIMASLSFAGVLSAVLLNADVTSNEPPIATMMDDRAELPDEENEAVYFVDGVVIDDAMIYEAAFDISHAIKTTESVCQQEAICAGEGQVHEAKKSDPTGKNYDPQQSMTMAIVFGTLGGLLVLGLVWYVTAFLFLNEWIVKNGRVVRAVRFGKVDGIIRCLVMPFSFEYRVESGIFAYKTDARN